MEDAVLVLAMLFVLVMSSYMLDRYSCMLVSQSGFALVFGLGVGLLLLATGKRESLSHHLNLDNTLFFDVLLPPIIYEGGFSIKRQAFFRNFPAIMSTAVLGTVIATGVTGGVLFAAGQLGAVPALSWVEAFLFGALISAVDPVATLACFNKLNAPPLLFNLVFGESVLNDAVAIALYQTLLKWQPDSGLSASELLSVAANTGGMFVGSLLVSAIITLLGAFLLKREAFATLRFFPTYEISLCLIFSLLTYFVADSLHLSGIVALFFSGTMTAHYHFHTISKEAQHSFTHLLHTTAFICENIVYVFMGTSVIMLFAGHVAKDAGTALRVDDLDWTFILLTLAACLVARFFNIFPLLGLSNCFRSRDNQIPLSYMTAIWIAGLRGSIAFALAKNWSYVGLKGKSHRKLVESTTLMVVLFTTIVVGGLTGPLLSLLGLVDKGDKDHTRVELDSDTGSSSDSGVQSPAAPPRLQTRHVPRRSMHYIVSHGVLSQPPPFVEVPTSESTTAATLDVLGRDAVLTPRPQMVDSEDDDDDDDNAWGQNLPVVSASHPPGIQRAASRSQRESVTGTFFRSWQTFDASYLQPIFGGHSQQPAGASSPRMSTGGQQQTAGDSRRCRATLETQQMTRPDTSAEAADASDAADPLLPPVEELERLVLEAYNSLQSDGEFLFLPDDVAQQLHAVARLTQQAADSDAEGDAEEQAGNQDAESGDEADDFADAITDQQELADLQEPEEENDGMHQQQQQEEAQEHGQQAVEATVKSPLLESKFMELPPVLEIDEEGSSDSQTNSPSTEGEVVMSTQPPPRPSSSSGATASSTSSTLSSTSSTNSSRRKSSLLPPPPPTPAPAHHIPATSPLRTAPRVASSPSAPTGSSRQRAARSDTKVTSFEARREAAQKLKEDKALREQRARDSAKKQREDARRKLEEAHQRQLEEKRERVRRMKMQREHTKPSSSASSKKPPSSSSSSNSGKS